MGACSDWHMESIEETCEFFAFDKLTREEAMDRLKRLGLDTDEAANLLNGAIA